MNHLTKEEISAWIAGVADRSPQQEKHVAECEVCSAELERMRTALGLFRASVREWAREIDSGAVFQIDDATKIDSDRQRARIWPSLRWAGAAAALVLAAVVWIRVHEIHSRQLQLQELERAHADDVLLRQVDAQISRSVPTSMEPLTSLVSWKDNPYEEGNSVQKNEGKNR